MTLTLTLGIFLNFKFCLEQNAGSMPFGVAQVGSAFPNPNPNPNPTPNPKPNPTPNPTPNHVPNPSQVGKAFRNEIAPPISPLYLPCISSVSPQVGKAFRNEIAPRGGLIRTREFTQAEIEYPLTLTLRSPPNLRLISA